METMQEQTKRFITTLSIVLLIAYSVVISGIGIYSFIRAQNLKQQIFSLTLVRQELETRTETISSQLQDYEKERTLLEQSLERLNKESEEKLNQTASEIESYKSRARVLTRDLDKAQGDLLALKEENRLLKETPLEDKQKQEELEQALVEKEGEVGELQEKISDLQQELNNKKATLHYNLAVNFSQMQDFENAIIEYKKALNIDPDHFSSHYNLGILLGN